MTEPTQSDSPKLLFDKWFYLLFASFYTTKIYYLLSIVVFFFL